MWLTRKDASITERLLFADANNEQYPIVVTLKKAMGIYISGKAQIPIMHGVFSLFIVTVILSVLWILNNYISKPIISLAKLIEDINLDSDTFDKLPTTMKNEFAILSSTVNKMLGRIMDERNRLRESESRLSMAQMIAHVGNWELDLRTKKVWASDEAFRIYGIEPIVPFLPLELIQGCVLPEYRKTMNDSLDKLIAKQAGYEVQYKIKRMSDSEERFLHSIASLIVNEDNESVTVSGVVQDITDSKKSEETILFNSYHDRLTGLYNRRFFDEQIEKIGTANIRPISIIIGDVNDLKLTNDAFGHQMGDQMLQKIADILKCSCRESNIVVRWGGDEFLILLPDTDYEETEKIVNIINTKCSSVFYRFYQNIDFIRI